jgi:prevent-host-death family protein
VLNRVAAGEEIEIVRNGAVVALLSRPKLRLLSAERFRELLDSAPPIDDAFAADVRSVRSEAGPPQSSWPS